jgi:hypothetical protein
MTKVSRDPYFTVDSIHPKPVRSTKLGCTYSATAYVAAATSSSIGKPVQLKIRESRADDRHDIGGGATSQKVELTADFQRLTVRRYRTRGARHHLDIFVTQYLAESGDAFYGDDFRLIRTNTC